MNYTEEYKKQLFECLKKLELTKKIKAIIPIETGYMVSDDFEQDIREIYSNTDSHSMRICDEVSMENVDIIFICDVFLCDNIDIVLRNVSQLMVHSEAKLIIDFCNAGYVGYTLPVFTGNGLINPPKSRYTVHSIESLLEEQGFLMVENCDFIHPIDKNDSEYADWEETLLNDYLLYAKHTMDQNADCLRMTRIYGKSNEIKEEPHKKYFLSVLIRTQGRRSLELEEALLSLYGQSDNDFEVLLMGHNLDHTGKETVKRIISDTPEDLRERIRYVDVTGGNRTTPLIRGFEIATSEYIAMLDDDDIVFDHWVEEFHKLAKNNKGKILHSYCARQDWLIIDNLYGGKGLRATGPFEKLYCRDFDELEQMSTNTCPIHSLAFPISAYNKFKIRFDEKLNVVEDWDFLMRSSFLCGVANVQEITSIYRIWRNAENSASIHGQNEWDDTRRYVIGKFDENPIVFPRGSASKLVKVIEERNSKYAVVQNESEVRKLWSFFVDLGDERGFIPERMRQQYVTVSTEGKFNVTFDGIDGYGTIKRIRLDPSEDSFIFLKSVKVTIEFNDGSSNVYDISSVTGNGIRLKEKLVFLDNDPQIIIENVTDKVITSVKYMGYIYYSLDGEVKDEISKIVYDYLYPRKKSLKERIFEKLEKKE